MSTNWHQFLVSQGYSQNDSNDYLIDNHEENELFGLCPVTQFGVIKVTGKDANTFLQGQVTCNIEDVSEHQSSFGAFCNPKGRTFSTFIIWQHNGDYLLLLPLQLVEIVINRLKLFILRSKVLVTEASKEFIQMGISCRSTSISMHPFLPNQGWSVEQQEHSIIIKIPSANTRFLIISNSHGAEKVWARIQTNIATILQSSIYWRQQDIFDGIPWISPETTELFIPQTMNVDKLGGISYNKGCYTGQEIVARTHYLGKIKRKLAQGKSISGPDPVPGETVHLTKDNKTSVGTILNVVRVQNHCYLSIVLIHEVADESAQEIETVGGSIISIA